MKKQRGSYTLEAVIVMSAVIGIILAILSAFLLLYQNAVMFYVATQAAQEGAIMWVDSSHDLEGNVSGSDANSRYYRLGELFNGGDQGKKDRIRVWAETKLKEMTPNSIVGSGAERVTVEFHNYALFRIIEVSIDKEIDIPFEQAAEYFGKDLDMHVKAKAMIADPAEYVRNVDYIVELSGEVWGMIQDRLGPLLKSKS